MLNRISRTADACGRHADDITLTAVSKVQPDPRIDAMLSTGQRVFGENRVQEAQSRWISRRDQFPELELRLIGPLQSNKAGDAVALFDVIESVDRLKLAQKLAHEMVKQDRYPKLYVQVNTGEEQQKAGVTPGEVDGLIDTIQADLNLQVEGVMCIPPVDEPPGPHFALLKKIADHHGLSEVSAGMSSDYEIAIRFGATHVRVGSALFGQREAG